MAETHSMILLFWLMALAMYLPWVISPMADNLIIEATRAWWSLGLVCVVPGVPLWKTQDYVMAIERQYSLESSTAKGGDFTSACHPFPSGDMGEFIAFPAADDPVDWTTTTTNDTADRLTSNPGEADVHAYMDFLLTDDNEDNFLSKEEFERILPHPGEADAPSFEETDIKNDAFVSFDEWQKTFPPHAQIDMSADRLSAGDDDNQPEEPTLQRPLAADVHIIAAAEPEAPSATIPPDTTVAATTATATTATTAASSDKEDNGHPAPAEDRLSIPAAVSTAIDEDGVFVGREGQTDTMYTAPNSAILATASVVEEQAAGGASPAAPKEAAPAFPAEDDTAPAITRATPAAEKNSADAGTNADAIFQCELRGTKRLWKRGRLLARALKRWKRGKLFAQVFSGSTDGELPTLKVSRAGPIDGTGASEETFLLTPGKTTVLPVTGSAFQIKTGKDSTMFKAPDAEGRDACMAAIRGVLGLDNDDNTSSQNIAEDFGNNGEPAHSGSGSGSGSGSSISSSSSSSSNNGSDNSINDDRPFMDKNVEDFVKGEPTHSSSSRNIAEDSDNRREPAHSSSSSSSSGSSGSNGSGNSRKSRSFPGCRGNALSPENDPLLVGEFMSTMPELDPANLEVTDIGDIILRRGDVPARLAFPSEDSILWAHRATGSFAGKASGGLLCVVESWLKEVPMNLAVKHGRWRVGRGWLCSMGKSARPAGAWRAYMPWDARGRAMTKASLKILDDHTLVVSSEGGDVFWSSVPSVKEQPPDLASDEIFSASRDPHDFWNT